MFTVRVPVYLHIYCKWVCVLSVKLRQSNQFIFSTFGRARTSTIARCKECNEALSINSLRTKSICMTKLHLSRVFSVCVFVSCVFMLIMNWIKIHRIVKLSKAVILYCFKVPSLFVKIVLVVIVNMLRMHVLYMVASILSTHINSSCKESGKLILYAVGI